MAESGIQNSELRIQITEFSLLLSANSFRLFVPGATPELNARAYFNARALSSNHDVLTETRDLVRSTILPCPHVVFVTL